MKTSSAWLSLLCAVCALLLPPAQRPGVFALENPPTVPTRTIVGDLLMIDRDLYVVRGDHGEIHIEAAPDTTIAEAFQFGDRIKALTLMNNKALTIERAAPGDAPGVVDNQPETGPVPAAAAPGAEKKADAPPAPPKRPARKTIVGDLLMIDRDLYVVRGDRGEIHIEAAPDTTIAEAFQFGDRIKALTLMNNKALTIERAAPGDAPGVVTHGAFLPPRSAPGGSRPDD